MSLSPLTDNEPTTVKEVLATPHWYHAMVDEFKALQGQKTWTLVPFHPSQHVIGCKWVFKVKRNSDGTVVRHKARLVAKGYLQEEGIDYQETFSPMAKQPTIRVLLCLALHFNWTIKQLDISNAFLHGVLHENVYMAQPPGFISVDSPTHVANFIKPYTGSNRPQGLGTLP